MVYAPQLAGTFDMHLWAVTAVEAVPTDDELAKMKKERRKSKVDSQLAAAAAALAAGGGGNELFEEWDKLFTATAKGGEVSDKVRLKNEAKRARGDVFEVDEDDGSSPEQSRSGSPTDRASSHRSGRT